MSGFVTSLAELTALFFNSFRLSVLLPSIVFSVVNVAIILPNFKHRLLGQIYFNMGNLERALILAIVIAFVTYLLNSLNFSIIRWFEGYPLLQWPWLRKGPGKWLQNIHHRRHSDLWQQLSTLKQDLGDVTTEKARFNPKHQKLTTDYQRLITELTLSYPSDPGRIVPTRFGNIIAAAEDYPHVLYKIDAVTLWPLLVPILTEQKYMKFIEREKGTLDFFINTLVLSAIVGLELVFVSWLNNAHLGLLSLQLFTILILVIVLYQLSIDGALAWATTIRTAFDLYRDHLRIALRIKQPEDFGDERYYWEQVSTFHKERNSDVGSDIFDYSQEALSRVETKKEPKEAEEENSSQRTE